MKLFFFKIDHSANRVKNLACGVYDVQYIVLFNMQNIFSVVSSRSLLREKEATIRISQICIIFLYHSLECIRSEPRPALAPQLSVIYGAILVG
jgi:hypothetical protein